MRPLRVLLASWIIGACIAGSLRQSQSAALDDLIAAARKEGSAEFFAAGTLSPEGGESSAFVPGTPAHEYAQRRKMVYMAQDQAEMVNRLTAVYGKLLGFTK